MSDYVLIADAACDLSPKQRKKADVSVIPLSVTIEGESYIVHPDDATIDTREFYQKIRDGIDASTSQINIVTFEDVFENVLKDGKDLIYLGFSSALTGGYSNAVNACKALSSKYPDRKIIAIDSQAASGGYALLTYLAGLKKQSGASFDELVDYIEKRKHHLCHWFTVNDLEYLKRGGRVSSSAALLGSLMGIKPVLHVDDTGFLCLVEKVRGRKASIEAMFRHMKETVVYPEAQTVFINHGDCREDAEYLAKLVKKEWKVRDVQINYIGPVIGAHCGAGVLALFFLGKEK